MCVFWDIFSLCFGHFDFFCFDLGCFAFSLFVLGILFIFIVLGYYFITSVIFSYLAVYAIIMSFYVYLCLHNLHGNFRFAALCHRVSMHVIFLDVLPCFELQIAVPSHYRLVHPQLVLIPKTPLCKKASNHHANLPLEMYSFTL